MNKNSVLYWSNMSLYEGCPQALLWAKGWDEVDVGNGPGQPKIRPTQKSAHHALMGIVIQAAIERMYCEEWYRNPMTLRESLMAAVEREWAKLEVKPRHGIDFSEAKMSREEMLQVCRDGVLGYLKTMKEHKLLGGFNKAEFDLKAWIDKDNAVGGRPDLIIRRDDTGVTILDGKNSNQKSKHLDPDQLRWYAMLWKLVYRQLPDRLAFVMYRFPFGMKTHNEAGEQITESGVEWVPFVEEDLRGLAQRALDVKQGMISERFDPTPSPSVCRVCDFEAVCPARATQKAENAAKRTPRERLTFEGEVSTEGFSDFSM